MKERFLATIAALLFVCGETEIVTLFCAKFRNTTKREYGERLGLDKEALIFIDDNHRYIVNYIGMNCKECDWFCRNGIFSNVPVEVLKAELFMMLKLVRFNVLTKNEDKYIKLAALAEIYTIDKSVNDGKFTLRELAEKLLEIGNRQSFDIEDWKLYGHNPLGMLLLWMNIKECHIEKADFDELTVDKLEMYLELWGVAAQGVALMAD